MSKIYEFSKDGGLKLAQDADLSMNQIVWLNGYGQNSRDHERQAIYDIELSEYDNSVRYKTVNLDTFVLSTLSAWEIKPDTEIFGIGIYYTKGDFATKEDIDKAIEFAIEKEKKYNIAKEKAEQEKLRVTVIGKEIFENNFPEDTKSIIIASCNQDESDMQTDYFGYKTNRTVILAFSKHNRDLFSEMRKAALNCDIQEIKDLANTPKNYEHREKYSMGAGYYLGKSKYSGWSISKTSLKYNEKENFYYLTGLENGFYAWKKEDKKVSKKIQEVAELIAE